MDNFTIFDMLYEDFKFTKPIRLIECFAGYGSQAMSLKRLGLNFEHWKICEWATKSIQAYKDVHFTNDITDYSKDLTQEQVVEYLAKKGVSMNYNEPMSLEQIKRKGESWQRQTYNNIIATHNLVNISQVKGKDLEIVDTDKYDYILTYSFPCQDLSLAGKRAGMEKDSGTRSGLLWEVERILDECKELGTLPQILLMENVPEVVGANNIEHFKKWRLKLEQLGYSNYDKILNAKDFGIPQNRRRCFMVSILGEYNYSFPQEFPLKLKLKDMLEDTVDEKYYLSQKMISYILDLDNTQKGTKWEGRADNDVVNPNVSHTLSVRGASGSQRCGVSNFICDNFDEEVKIFEIKNECEKMNDNLLQTIGKIDKWHQRGIIYNSEGISRTICSTDYKTPKFVGQLEVKRVGGLFDKDEKKHQAGSVYDVDGLSPTLDTANGGYRQPCVVVVGNYSPSNHNASRIVDSKGIAPIVMENHGTVTAMVEVKSKNGLEIPLHKDTKLLRETIEQNDLYEGEVANLDLYNRAVYKHSQTLTEPHHNTQRLWDGLRIRKLTPRECGRLMGVSDDDITKMAQNQSDASLYHLFGDSIVVDVLYYIFKQLL